MKKSDFNLGAETLKVSRRVCDSEVGPPTTLKSAEPVPLPEELFKIVSGWFKSPGFFETEEEWLFASPRTGLPYTQSFTNEDYLIPSARSTSW